MSSFILDDTRKSDIVNDVVIKENSGELKTKARQYLHAKVAENGDVDVNIAVQNEWTEVTGNLFTEHHSSQDINLVGTNGIGIVEAGIYQITLSIPVGLTVAEINSIDIGYAVNGDAPTALIYARPFSTTLPDGASGIVIDPLQAGDVIKLFVRNKESTNGVRFLQEGNFTIHYIGEIP